MIVAPTPDADAVILSPTKSMLVTLPAVPTVDPSSLMVILPPPPPPEASAPINLPVAESYFKNLPSTLALSRSTSSRNSRRVSPPPPSEESCCWILFTKRL